MVVALNGPGYQELRCSDWLILKFQMVSVMLTIQASMMSHHNQNTGTAFPFWWSNESPYCLPKIINTSPEWLWLLVKISLMAKWNSGLLEKVTILSQPSPIPMHVLQKNMHVCYWIDLLQRPAFGINFCSKLLCLLTGIQLLLEILMQPPIF